MEGWSRPDSMVSMRLDAILIRAIGFFTLLGILMFGRRVPAPAPALAPMEVAGEIATEDPPPRVATVQVEKLSAELLDRIAEQLDGESKTPLPVFELPPIPPFGWTFVTPEAEDPIRELDPLPDTLTLGRRAALRAILEGAAYLLYFGTPPGNLVEPDGSDITLIEDSSQGVRAVQRLPHESIGDSVDPALAEYVHDFNLQMLHAQKSGLIRTREVEGLWSAAAALDRDADDALFDLLDDPTDAIATAYDPETGACELDLGKRNGVSVGMRFVLWTQGRPLRRVLALAEVERVTNAGCRVRIVKSFAGSWPSTPGIRASNPLFHRGRKVTGLVLGATSDRSRKLLTLSPHTSIYDDISFPDFCVVGDLPKTGHPDGARLVRAQEAGAIIVPERLVPYLLPSR